jgi:hypothetical protein
MDRQRESPRRLQGAEGEYRSCQDKKMKAEGMGPSAIAKTLKLGRASVYRALTN